MKSFNLSEWALSHRSFVWFLMVVAIVAGAMSYRKLGREEDPAFAIKTMVVQAVWPGATISDTLDQVTDRIEKELQQIGAVDYTKSYTTPGQATVFVNLRDTTPPQTIPWLFYQVRKRLGDIKGTFPQGMQGPFFNDEFGDVYGNVYAFTADGLSMRQLRDYVETVRTRIIKVPSIGKTHHRRPERGDLSRLLDPQARRPRRRRAVADQDAAGPERGGALGRDPGRAGAGLGPGRRPVHRREQPEGDQPAGQRPLLPPLGRGRDRARLHRSARARSSATTAGRRSGSPSPCSRAATCSNSARP